METMTLTIQVPKNIGAVLEEKAKNQGKDVAEYVENLIEKDIDRRKTLDEILAPVRKDFAESGMTEDELDELIESERQAMWEEKNGRRG
jgi:Asp-tRNA(Asn)/Glu-tRNA(Gln) amidotransferase C subunit